MIPLEPTHYFHIYNRANGFEKIFLYKSNYLFFQDKYRLYVDPFVHTFCYCLMPNHIHFLVQIKSMEDISRFLVENEKEKGDLKVKKFMENPELFVSKQFSNLFSSYTQSFNKQQGRMGSLFMKNFKKKPVNDESYLKKLIHYIHSNPVEARLCERPEDWLHSSYNSIVDAKNEVSKQVISWFDDVEGFRAFHRLPPTFQIESI